MQITASCIRDSQQPLPSHTSETAKMIWPISWGFCSPFPQVSETSWIFPVKGISILDSHSQIALDVLFTDVKDSLNVALRSKFALNHESYLAIMRGTH